jgi:FtsH-binding integral membrane protein
MNLPNNPNSYDIYRQDMAASNATFMSRVYFWMMLGLALSGLVAYGITGSQEATALVIGNRVVFFGLIIAQFGAVIALSMFINRMSAWLTTAVYLGYAILSGITFSVVCFAFTAASIYQAFFITAFSFVGLSVFGYVTKRDLGPVGSFCMTGLFGMIGLILLGLIFPSIMTNAVSMTINVCGIIIFAGLTAYDTQKIKSFNVGMASADVVKKQAIHGALILYLDFINLFLSILQLTGDRR